MLTNRQLFFQHLAQTSDFPVALEIERTEGIYMFSPEGKKYIDLISGIAVSNVGHRHPNVLKAINEQLDKYMHLMVYGEYVQTPQVRLAAKISELLPDSLDNVFFVNSGTEATEGALKLAKRYTHRSQIISFRNAYHGSSHGAISLMSDKDYKRAFVPLLPDVAQINFNDVEALNEITERTACVIIEPIQGEAGAIVADHNFLHALRNRCTETGTLLIFDEVQTAFGRTGNMFAFEHYGVVPDIITFAKGMGGGMPIGAFVASSEIMNVFRTNPMLGHITTFGGHPVSCAASLATIQTIIEEKLTEQVHEKADLFRNLLVHPLIKNISGKGLLLAVELGNFETVNNFIKKGIENGVVSDWFLFNDKCFRLAPPLIITKEQIKDSCQLILKSLDELID